MSTSTSKRYPVELRERAVRMVVEIRSEHESEWAAMGRVAELLGIGTPETVRKWCRQAEVDAGRTARPGNGVYARPHSELAFSRADTSGE
jgi:transposase